MYQPLQTTRAGMLIVEKGDNTVTAFDKFEDMLPLGVFLAPWNTTLYCGSCPRHAPFHTVVHL